MIWNSLPLLPPPADLNDISVSLKQRHMYLMFWSPSLLHTKSSWWVKWSKINKRGTEPRLAMLLLIWMDSLPNIIDTIIVSFSM